MPPVLRTDGVPLLIQWEKFKVGSSFYIPTLTPEVLVRKIKEEAKKGNMTVRWQRRLEGNTMGVRIWRIK